MNIRPRFHTVQAGETLSAIAKRYGVTLEQIRQLNEVEDFDYIRVGQRIALAPEAVCQVEARFQDPLSRPIGHLHYEIRSQGNTLAAGQSCENGYAQTVMTQSPKDYVEIFIKTLDGRWKQLYKTLSGFGNKIITCISNEVHIPVKTYPKTASHVPHGLLLQADGTVKTVENPQELKQKNNKGHVTSLLLPKCEYKGLVFPLKIKPLKSYKTGGRFFGAKRPNGRKHAGCDLLAPPGTPVYAMDDGVIVREPYKFYAGTFALELMLNNNLVIRYGEISDKLPSEIKRGAKVSKGQIIGYTVKNKKDGACMLHLEIYKGSASGNLTSTNKPYMRRKDIIDPTTILDKLNQEIE